MSRLPRSLALAGFLASSCALLAQFGAGTILGTVTDPTGAVVPNATVTARNNATNESRTFTTDTEGAYRFNALQNGAYTITVTAPSFKAASISSVMLTVNTQVRADVTMQLVVLQGRAQFHAPLADHSKRVVELALAPLIGVTEDAELAGKRCEVGPVPLCRRRVLELVQHVERRVEACTLPFDREPARLQQFFETRLALERVGDVGQRHSEKLEHQNLLEARQIRVAIDAVTRARTVRLEETDAVVMVKRPHGDAGQLREFLDAIRTVR